MPSYPGEIHQENREALARGAAEVLGWDRGQMEAWLLFGQEEPTLEAFLAELPNLARCAGPDCKGRWHKRSEIVKGLTSRAYRGKGTPQAMAGAAPAAGGAPSAMPALMCTTRPPAKSKAPISAIQPPPKAFIPVRKA